jgi:hypothetical protein
MTFVSIGKGGSLVGSEFNVKRERLAQELNESKNRSKLSLSTKDATAFNADQFVFKGEV